MTFNFLWEELEKESQESIGTGILKRMIDPNITCTMFLGIQRPSRSRVFLIPVPRKLLHLKHQIPESKGFKLTLRTTGEEAETHETCILSASDPTYNEVFSVMIQNLYESLKDCNEERDIMRLLIACLCRWQLFFEKHNCNGLSKTAQRGLYGELFFLNNHLLSIPEYYDDEISAWTGATARQHDFQFGNTAVEIKTCSTKQHQKILISNEQQLDNTLIENLFIFHLSLSSIENHTDTLPALIDQIRKKLQLTRAALIFDNALQMRDYLDIHAWRYQQTGYVIRESNLFRVTGDFPRLTEKDLPTGVGDLSYSISVSECKRFARPFKELISLIRGTA